MSDEAAALRALRRDQVAELRRDAADLRRQAAAKDAKADVIVQTWELDEPHGGE